MWDILYRPRKYSDVLGQTGSVRLLKTRIMRGTAFDTSYIFAGGYGQGKTTLSRIHAMAMLCQDLNQADPEPCGQCDSCKDILQEQSEAFTERDAASSGSTDSMRTLVEELPYALSNAPKRIYLIDECQRMHHAAQDVLLKPIEEKKMVAILCTTEAEKIRGAIRSRCEEYTIKKATREDVLPRMKMVLDEQGVQHDDEAVLIIIDRAGGHVRNALNNLEMVSQLGAITVDSVREYLNLSVVTLYYQILLSLDDPLKAIDLLRQACEATPADEVAAGLAEAAMNCYRMAHRWHADLAYVDKNLAGQVYSKYQDHVVKFSKWFLGHRNVTRLTLELDILAFSQNAGRLPPETAQPPVVFISQVSSAPQLVIVDPAPEVTIEELSPDEVVSEIVPDHVPTIATPGRPTTEPVGAQFGLGFTDPTPPDSPIEETASGRSQPRQRAKQNPAPVESKPRGNQQGLAPAAWRAEFLRLHKKRSVDTPDS